MKQGIIKWHETCKCICKLDAIVCHNKRHWNNDKCWCKCKELIDKGVCNNGMLGILVIVSVNGISHVMLFSIFFTINIGIGGYFVQYKYMNHGKETASRYDYVYQTTI